MPTRTPSKVTKSSSEALSVSRILDEHSTLNAINQILQRSETLESATLNSIALVLSPNRLNGAYLAILDNPGTLRITHSSERAVAMTTDIEGIEIARELQREYPALPDLALRLEVKFKGGAQSGPQTIYLKRISPEGSGEAATFIILSFPGKTELSCGDIHALEVAASVLRHKISLGDVIPARKPDPLDTPSRYKLSERQITISKMILDGLTNKEIAHELSLSAATIRYECVRLYERLGAKNRASAAAILQNLFSGNQITSRAR